MLIACLALVCPTHAVELGEIPPDYLGKSTTSEEIRLSDSAGRIRIVTFWATWCAPCLKELPVLNVIQRHGGKSRLKIIAVNLRESKKQYRKALRAYDDFVIDFVHDVRGTVAKRYGVKGIPHMLIVDANGRVAYQHTGYNEDALEDIVAEINALLVQLEQDKQTVDQDEI